MMRSGLFKAFLLYVIKKIWSPNLSCIHKSCFRVAYSLSSTMYPLFEESKQFTYSKMLILQSKFKMSGKADEGAHIIYFFNVEWYSNKVFPMLPNSCSYLLLLEFFHNLIYLFCNDTPKKGFYKLVLEFANVCSLWKFSISKNC